MKSLKKIRAGIGWRVAPDRMIRQLTPRPDAHLDDVYMDRGLILIHIPKNAGTSVEDALFGYRVRHRTWQEVKAICPRAWQSLPKIAIVRDPVDRFLSAFDYLKSGGRNEHDRMFSEEVIGEKSIEALLDHLSASRSYRDTVTQYFHFRRQTDYVCDGTTVMVDHLIPFHRMAEALANVAGIAHNALTHANKTTGERTKRGNLSTGYTEKIIRLYASDADLFARACKVWEVAQTPHVDEAQVVKGLTG